MTVEVVIEGGDPVAVDGLDFLGFLRDLAEPDFFRAVFRLLEIDKLEAQIDPPARLGPQALCAPVGVDRAKGAAATGIGTGWSGQSGCESDSESKATVHGIFFSLQGACKENRRIARRAR